MNFEEILVGYWPQIVALFTFAVVAAQLREKVHQAEKKIESLYELVNKILGSLKLQEFGSLGLALPQTKRPQETARGRFRRQTPKVRQIHAL